MILYADKLRRLAPRHNPRHVAAWMLVGNSPEEVLRLLREDAKPQPLAAEQLKWLRDNGFSEAPGGKPVSPVSRLEREVERAIDALRSRSPEFSERLARDAGL